MENRGRVGRSRGMELTTRGGRRGNRQQNGVGRGHGMHTKSGWQEGGAHGQRADHLGLASGGKGSTTDYGGQEGGC